MKTLIFSLVLLSTSAFAGSLCPAGTNQTDVCISTPQAGDQQLASEFAKKITVCASSIKHYLIVETSSTTKPQVMPVSGTRRAGGDSYVFKSTDVDLVFNIVRSARPTADRSTPAKLKLLFNGVGLSASSTYKCQ